MKSIPLATVAMVLLFGSVSGARADCPAEGFVLSAGNAFLAAARNGSPSAFTSAASRYADLRSIALFALGPHRKSLPKGMEAEYVSLAKAYMGQFMSKHAAKFAGSGLKITTCSGTTVNASTAAGKKLIFRVSGGKGHYRVQDVNAASIWLAGQMRSTFVGVINRNNGDINALFRFLRG
ncbi:MAG: ABC transporter substrate-binding protein [Phyllobacteriaceae bacterium]|nr:ABC transporter substrate-binding protein [Phyllobacteriaceae bacterium]